MAPQAPGNGERLAPRKRRRVGSSGSRSSSKALASDPNWSSAGSGGSESDWSPDSASSTSASESEEENGETGEIEAKFKKEEKEPEKRGVAGNDLLVKEEQVVVRHSAEFFCALCGREFSFKHALVRHIKRRHKSAERPLECEQCKFAFKTEQELEKHVKDHISKRYEEASASTEFVLGTNFLIVCCCLSRRRGRGARVQSLQAALLNTT